MSSWLVVALLGLCIVMSGGVSTAAADDNQPAGTRVYGMTPGRLWATIDAVVGLVSVIIAGRSVTRTGAGRRNGAVVAMVAGLIVIAYAVLHLTLFTGDFGTGGGRAGAIIAILFGVTSVILSGIALKRSRPTG